MAAVTITVPLLSPGSAARRTGPRPESWTIPPVDVNETFIRKLAILILSLVDPFDAFYIRWTADNIRSLLCADNEIVPWLTWINRASYQMTMPLPRVPKNLDRLIYTLLPSARISATTGTFNSSWKIAETMTLIGLPTPKEKVLAMQHCLRNALDYKKLPRCRDPLPRSILGVAGLHRRMTTLEQRIGEPALDTRFTVVLALSQDYAWPQTVKTLAVTGELDHLQVAAMQQLPTVQSPVLAVVLVVVVLLTPPFETQLEIPHPGFPFEAEIRDNFFLGLNNLQARYGLQNFAQSLTPAMANLPDAQVSDVAQWNRYWDATFPQVCPPPAEEEETPRSSSDKQRQRSSGSLTSQTVHPVSAPETFPPIPPALYVLAWPIIQVQATAATTTSQLINDSRMTPSSSLQIKLLDSASKVQKRVGMSNADFHMLTTFARQAHSSYLANNPDSPYADPHVVWGGIPLKELAVIVQQVFRLCESNRVFFPPKTPVELRVTCIEQRVYAARKTWMYATRDKLKRANKDTTSSSSSSLPNNDNKRGPPPSRCPPPSDHPCQIHVQEQQPTPPPPPQPTIPPTLQPDPKSTTNMMHLQHLLCS
ncbi:uncharacterized protein Z520_12289 [Fonsecaea multimorphosa CBS 102226]|uniref:Uncharacterized protein n=1 Tax=Fonsecaea multimorphosa CBS 102226 TaxID=1442371 RepID=A0A0D2K6M0_9EURO|nr:uncharacterized protein Z520_12289 [Fonsecaea multimorphosa CBS 102226]KIX92018.1 hypothetical protein Z520_12289 [Fonsecaea multimorphosa CBS 102226]OAL17375.1 hypothetical protein AYO22_11742 [Fonsecaea multimorphosa]